MFKKFKINNTTYTHVGLLDTLTNQVYHNKKNYGVVCEPLEKLQRESHVEIVGIQPHDYNKVKRTANKLIGHPYDLFVNNCEHFVTECLGENPNSPQIRDIVTLSTILVGFYFIVK